MKLKKFKIKNFRGYRNQIEIDIDNLTAFVGKNDVGKSTVLEAMDIFFNESKGVVSLDYKDLNVQAKNDGETDIEFSAIFDELPDSLVIDTSKNTSLSAEYMLNEDGKLEIIKRFIVDGTPKTISPKVFVVAKHPTNPSCAGLLLKKNTELKAIINRDAIECENQSVNAVMRAAIWNHYQEDLNLQLTEIDVSNGDMKTIWPQLSTYLPVYSLFQADRRNSDNDSEVQDPLIAAVKQIIAEEHIQAKLSEVAAEVEKKLQEVSDRTLEKLREMAPDVANTLQPDIPSRSTLKWDSVFKTVSITGDESIPINKRGSGIKRLILLNFFRAEAEKKRENVGTGIIYAIEEPETSQHTANQRLLVEAFKELAQNGNTQVVLTTHSGFVVKALDFNHLRIVCDDKDNGKVVTAVKDKSLPYPSLNEVNYLAFGDINEEYHNELYGYIESTRQLENYKKGKEPQPYIKECIKKGNCYPKEEKITLTEYIRNQIHHPENKRNIRYTQKQLEESIRDMRDFISMKMQDIAGENGEEI